MKGQGFNFGKGERAAQIKRELARMARDPERARRLFGLPPKDATAADGQEARGAGRDCGDGER